MEVTVQKTDAGARSVSVVRPANFVERDERWFPTGASTEPTTTDVFLINGANVTAPGVIFDGLRLFELALVYPKFKSAFGTRHLLKWLPFSG